MYYIINPGPETLDLNYPTLTAVTSAGLSTSYWGLRFTSGALAQKIAGSDNKVSYTPVMSDFPGAGEYFLVAVSTSGCISNEKKILVNCSGTNSNKVINGTFDQVGKVGVGLGDINGNGVIEFGQGEFESDYIQRDPADTESDGTGVGTMQWGSFTVGTNPRN
jgi:hypothetical protein